MSSRCGLTALLLLLPCTGVAQNVDTTYEARLARLKAEYVEAAAAVRADDSARLTRRDTVRVNELRVLARIEDTASVRRAGVSAYAVLSRTFGRGVGGLADTVIATPDAPGWTETEFANGLIAWGTAVLMASDSVAQRWLGAARIDSTAVPGDNAAAYIDLVTAPSRAARGCYRGSLADCRIALGISDTADMVLAAFDAADRQALVRWNRSRLWDAGSAGPIHDCLAGDDSNCVRLLRSLPTAQVGSPMSAGAHASLLAVALVSGGPEAFVRFRGARALPLDARLAQAAGMSSDELLLRWRGRVLAARPARVTTPAPLAFAALGWTLIFGLAATRSSRWR